MPIRNLTSEKLIYTYLPSIDARPTNNISEWYTLEDNEEAKFTSILQNDFVNFWVGKDYPWNYFYFQCTDNLKNLWYGPLKITDNITIKEINTIPVLFNNNTQLTPGFGSVTSFANHQIKENPTNSVIVDKLQYVGTIFSIVFIMLVFVFMYIRFLL